MGKRQSFLKKTSAIYWQSCLSLERVAVRGARVWFCCFFWFCLFGCFFVLFCCLFVVLLLLLWFFVCLFSQEIILLFIISVCLVCHEELGVRENLSSQCVCSLSGEKCMEQDIYYIYSSPEKNLFFPSFCVAYKV